MYYIIEITNETKIFVYPCIQSWKNIEYILIYTITLA